MNPDNEAELNSLLDGLHAFQDNTLPDKFIEISRAMIIPTLEDIARRVRDGGHDCRVDEFIEEPVPSTGQAIYLTFETSYGPGETSLCIRLMPGESIVKIETPAAGATVTQNVPISQLTQGNIERVAIEYLRKSIQ
jgi:hypothetical protein